jgi:hypothetical protein
MSGNPSASITSGPKASKARLVVISGSRAKRNPHRKAIRPLNRTGFTGVSFMGSALGSRTFRRTFGRRFRASGDKTMRKDSGRPLAQSPMLLAGPQCAKVVVREPGARANDGVVNGRIAASNHPQQSASADYEFGTSRFAGHDEPCQLRHLGKQPSQLPIGKVMQE